MATLSNKNNIGRWRDAFAKTMANLRPDSPPETWKDVFVPPTHYKALHPQTMLVEGMRGAGKSFWTKVLHDTALRNSLAQSNTDVRLKAELQRITDCKALLWDKTDSQDLPDQISVTRWLSNPDFEPMLFWAVVVLAQFEIDPALGMPVSDPFEPWKARVEWAQGNPERVTRAIKLLDSKFTAAGETVLVVIDGLDRVSTRFAHTQSLMRGLFQLLLEFRYAKGLRFKVFVREDILSNAAATVSDASKIINEKVTLDWTQQDLFGLAFHTIAQEEGTFRRRYEEISAISGKSVGERWDHPELLNAVTQEKFWVWLAGPYMGNTATKGHTYSWIFKHLADGKGRISPRTFLLAVKESLTVTQHNYAAHEFIIHHEAIRDGVRLASNARVGELDNEYHWVRQAVEIIQTKGRTVPIDWTDLRSIWMSNKASGADTVSLIEKQQANALIPWESDSDWDTKVNALRDTMSNIGVLQLRERQSVLRIDLPDIFRLAYKIGRNGGIAVNRKP
jgi:hypothetical protein